MAKLVSQGFIAHCNFKFMGLLLCGRTCVGFVLESAEPGESNESPSISLSRGNVHIILTAKDLDLLSQLRTLSRENSCLDRILNTFPQLILHYSSCNSYAWFSNEGVTKRGKKDENYIFVEL